MFALPKKRNDRVAKRTSKASRRPPSTFDVGVIQPKLRMNAPQDPLEREADDVAERVMRVPAGQLAMPQATTPKEVATTDGVISRKCDSCEAEEESDERLSLKTNGNIPHSGMIPNSIASGIAGAREVGGRELAPETRQFFEPRFGQSFEHVRLHVGGSAEWLASGLGARAFTVGSDVFVRNSEYHPDTDSGRRLLAHELAHTIQQQGEQPRVQRWNEQSIDPVQEITWGRINDSYALLDLLRGLSRSELKSTRTGLRDFLESGDPDEDLAAMVQAAIEEISRILTGETEAITIERCESTPPTVPQSVWQADPNLIAIRNGSQSAMRVGSSGFHVQLVQMALRYWGCEHAIPRGEHLGKFGVDGNYGTFTRRAVQAFQSQRGLQVDGRVGPQTLMSLEEIAVVPDEESDAPENLTCPPRVDGEYEWAKNVPLTLSVDESRTENGVEVRKWVLSGFPIGEAAPLASQGSVNKTLREVFSRLGPSGVRARDVPGREIYVCDNLTRRVAVFGTGDCHAPELTTQLKALRTFTVTDAWPDSLRRYLVPREETHPASFEDKMGKFPAGTNATREDRAQNRGVVLIEQIDTKPRERDELKKQFEQTRVRLRVERDFRKLFELASKRVGYETYVCMLEKIRFNGTLPIEHAQDQFITAVQVPQLYRKKIPSKENSHHLGTYILDQAVRRNIWMPTEGDETLTKCGQGISPAEDPVDAMFQAISSSLDILDRGTSEMTNLKETEHGIAIMDWINYNDEIEGLLSCYRAKGLFEN